MSTASSDGLADGLRLFRRLLFLSVLPRERHGIAERVFVHGLQPHPWPPRSQAPLSGENGAGSSHASLLLLGRDANACRAIVMKVAKMRPWTGSRASVGAFDRVRHSQGDAAEIVLVRICAILLPELSRTRTPAADTRRYVGWFLRLFAVHARNFSSTEPILMRSRRSRLRRHDSRASQKRAVGAVEIVERDGRVAASIRIRHAGVTRRSHPARRCTAGPGR